MGTHLPACSFGASIGSVAPLPFFALQNLVGIFPNPFHFLSTLTTILHAPFGRFPRRRAKLSSHHYYGGRTLFGQSFANFSSHSLSRLGRLICCIKFVFSLSLPTTPHKAVLPNLRASFSKDFSLIATTVTKPVLPNAKEKSSKIFHCRLLRIAFENANRRPAFPFEEGRAAVPKAVEFPTEVWYTVSSKMER